MSCPHSLVLCHMATPIPPTHLVCKARVLVPGLHELPPHGMELLVVGAQQSCVPGFDLPPPLLLLLQQLQRPSVCLSDAHYALY